MQKKRSILVQFCKGREDELTSCLFIFKFYPEVGKNWSRLYYRAVILQMSEESPEDISQDFQEYSECYRFYNIIPIKNRM